MTGEGLTFECSFRFLELTSEQLASLNKKFTGAEFGEHFKTKKATCALLINQGFDINKLVAFIESHSIMVSAYDIFISITTEYDTRIIDIPQTISEIVAATKSKLVFSYTCV